MSDESSLLQIKNMKTASLGRKEVLGESMHFEEVIPDADKIVELSKQFDERIVREFPETNREEIYSVFDSVFSAFKRVLEFDNSIDDARQKRNRFINQFPVEYSKLFDLWIKYSSTFEYYSSAQQKSEALEEKIRKQEDAVSSFISKTNSRLFNVKSEFDAFEKNNNESQSKVSDSVSHLNEEVKNKLIQVSNELESFKAQTTERLGLDAAHELWDSKRATHRFHYFAVGFILLLLLFVLPGVAIFFIQIIADGINAVSQKLTVNPSPEIQKENPLLFALTNQLTRLLIIGLPITAYVWATRIFVRIFLNNRALMDDAFERKTMFDTYIYLVGQDQANEADRPLILNALFRPSPGQAPDIEPPNLSEVIKIKAKEAG